MAYAVNHHRRLAIVGNSNADDLHNMWQSRWGEEPDTTVNFYGRRGARVVNHDLTTFKDEFLDSILQWRPHYVIIWLGGNDLNQDLRHGEWNDQHFRPVFEAFMELCNAIAEGIRPHGGQILMMPLVPRTKLRYGESTRTYFKSVRSFNNRFRRLPKAMQATSCYELAGFHAFRKDGDALRDGVHFTFLILNAICVDIRRNYFEF